MKPYHDTYILVGHDPVPCEDMVAAITWWHEHLESDCRVGRTYLGDGVLCVYTTFLGRNHDFSGVPGAAPVLFETMIHDERAATWWDEQWRCATWSQAEDQHAQACDYARRKLAGEQVEDAPRHIGVLLDEFLTGRDEKA